MRKRPTVRRLVGRSLAARRTGPPCAFHGHLAPGSVSACTGRNRETEVWCPLNETAWNSDVLRETRKKDSQTKRAKVLVTVDAMKAKGEPVTFIAVARTAGVQATRLRRRRPTSTSRPAREKPDQGRTPHEAGRQGRLRGEPGHRPGPGPRGERGPPAELPDRLVGSDLTDGLGVALGDLSFAALMPGMPGEL